MMIDIFRKQLKRIDPNLIVKENKAEGIFELFRRRSYLFKVDHLDKRVLTKLHEGDMWKEDVVGKVDRHNKELDKNKDREFELAGKNFADKVTQKNY